jgi:hypothetical protein
MSKQRHAEVARRLGIDSCIKYCPRNGGSSQTVLSLAICAVIGAVYLDSVRNFGRAFRVIKRLGSVLLQIFICVSPTMLLRDERMMPSSRISYDGSDLVWHPSVGLGSNEHQETSNPPSFLTDEGPTESTLMVPLRSETMLDTPSPSQLSAFGLWEMPLTSNANPGAFDITNDPDQFACNFLASELNGTYSRELTRTPVFLSSPEETPTHTPDKAPIEGNLSGNDVEVEVMNAVSPSTEPSVTAVSRRDERIKKRHRPSTEVAPKAPLFIETKHSPKCPDNSQPVYKGDVSLKHVLYSLHVIVFELCFHRLDLSV